MARIFLFRHGESTDNRDRIFSGDRDPDLTEKGIKEAEIIREKLRNERVTKAFTSDRLRSKKTLDIVLGSHRGIKPIIDLRLRERDYGELTGKNKDEVARQFPEEYPLWHRSYKIAPPGGESLEIVEKRVLSFLEDILPTLTADDVVFISASANSLRPIRRYFEKMTADEMVSFEHTPAAVYEYQA